ncbi:MAG: hypothetical protein J3K34DRAFT_433159 [Monoraphidium minutum]|nr:MAG: hypothetical protein J3K34DRAFT_433159 [Monoraphidium minutum]
MAHITHMGWHATAVGHTQQYQAAPVHGWGCVVSPGAPGRPHAAAQGSHLGCVTVSGSRGGGGRRARRRRLAAFASSWWWQAPPKPARRRAIAAAAGRLRGTSARVPASYRGAAAARRVAGGGGARVPCSPPLSVCQCGVLVVWLGVAGGQYESTGECFKCRRLMGLGPAQGGGLLGVLAVRCGTAESARRGARAAWGALGGRRQHARERNGGPGRRRRRPAPECTESKWRCGRGCDAGVSRP